MAEEATLTAVIVDHSADLRLLTRTTLEIEHAARVVGEAADALEALDLIDELQPNVAIIDLHLPGIDGLDLIDFLRRRRTSLRLIAYSGDHRALQDAMRRGAHLAVLKTGDQTGLVAALAGDEN
jgi:two-component system nitrate/nitrite response regulator NarL